MVPRRTSPPPPPLLREGSRAGAELGSGTLIFNIMDTHALRVLEFDAIRKQLADQTACSLGREKAEAMTPSDWLPQAKARLDETTECRTLMSVKGNLPLGGVTDIRPLLRSAEIGAALDPHGLLDIVGVAAASRSLKLFLQKIAPDYPIMAEKASGLGQFPVAGSRRSMPASA